MGDSIGKLREQRRSNPHNDCEHEHLDTAGHDIPENALGHEGGELALGVIDRAADDAGAGRNAGVERRELFADAKSVIFKLLFPLLGGLGLFAVLIVTLHDSASPEYGSGASLFGVGLVLVLGLGLIILGLILMVVWRSVQPAFFRGETLHKDTPTIVE